LDAARTKTIEPRSGFNPFRVGERGEFVLPLATPRVTEIAPLSGLAYPAKVLSYPDKIILLYEGGAIIYLYRLFAGGNYPSALRAPPLPGEEFKIPRVLREVAE
jgi:hypothetical protein